MIDAGRTRKLNILVCAYACEPGCGSEETVGWDTAVSLARSHRVVVLTRTVHARVLDAAVRTLPPGVELSFVYYDLPQWLLAACARLGKPGVEISYYLWLFSSRTVVRELHDHFAFDTAQHVTYARYWTPSPLATLPIPFIWGPVGGGESIPDALKSTLSLKGRVFEWVRDAMRLVGECSLPVRRTARKSTIALANTEETANRLRAIGARHVVVENSAALSQEDLLLLSGPKQARGPGPTFASVGRLLDWKGFHLGLEAFAAADLKDATYFIVGDGPARVSLESLAVNLGVADRVHFTKRMPRVDVLSLMASIDALIHPSLHESGGYVCLEAMAAGTPVVCLDIGGPGLFVDYSHGYPVPSGSPPDVICGLSRAIKFIADQPHIALARGERARSVVLKALSMTSKAKRLLELHETIEREGRLKTRRPGRQLAGVRRARPGKGALIGSNVSLDSIE